MGPWPCFLDLALSGLELGARWVDVEEMAIHAPRVRSMGGIPGALEWDVPKISPDHILQFVAEAYKCGRTCGLSRK